MTLVSVASVDMTPVGVAQVRVTSVSVTPVGVALEYDAGRYGAGAAQHGGAWMA